MYNKFAMENNSAKQFVLQLGALSSLYLSITFLLVLLFGVINLAYPDVADGYWSLENDASNVRMGIAMVVVFFPAYLVLTRLVNKNRRADEKNSYLNITKWLVYLSLLVGGIVMLIDLVVVIRSWLEGELTVRFILKALAVLVIVGAAFNYYLLDVKGYWLKEEKKSIIYGVVMAIIVAASVMVGLSKIDAPNEVRDARLDRQQIMDLQNIQYQIEAYYMLNNTLPEQLNDLEKPGVLNLPTPDSARGPYTYERTQSGFNLCATFAEASSQSEMEWRPFPDEKFVKNSNDWTHGAGRYCFERVLVND